MSTAARATIWVSFLLAVAGFGSWLIGWPPVIMLVSVGAAAFGLFVLIPYFSLRVPKPVIEMTVHLDQAVEDAVAVVRAALASSRWVEPSDPELRTPLYAGGGGDGGLLGFLVQVIFEAALATATAKARTVAAPPAPGGAMATLLCHPPKQKLQDVHTIVRISVGTDAAGSPITVAGTSLRRDKPALEAELALLRDAIARAADAA